MVSHSFNIKDKQKILEFYVDLLGFKVSDSGPVFENGPEIIFISYNPNEHHQLAFVLEIFPLLQPSTTFHLE